jgi:hypothetical protein
LPTAAERSRVCGIAAHIGRSWWLPQDAGGAISDSDTARLLDDLVADTTR